MDSRQPTSPTRPFPLEPAPIRVPGEVLEDLRRRLAATRWPLDAGNDDGYYGVRRAYLQELVAYWADGFDWRAAERAINAYEHYRADVGWELPGEWVDDLRRTVRGRR